MSSTNVHKLQTTSTYDFGKCLSDKLVLPCYFRPVKTTTLTDKRPVKIFHKFCELQTTSSPQMPIEDVQLRVQTTTYQHKSNDLIR